MENESGTNLKALLCQFLIERHREKILEIVESTDIEKKFVVLINLVHLFSQVPVVSNNFLANGHFHVRMLQEALIEAQKILIEEEKENFLSDKKLSLKEGASARINILPEDQNVMINFPTCKDINKLVSFHGKVTKAFDKAFIETAQIYACLKCGSQSKAYCDYSQQDLFLKPVSCSNEDCNSTNFKLNTNPNTKIQKCSIRDYQEIKVQEHLGLFSLGTVPKSVKVLLENDLVDSCKAGDDVTINATVIERWNRLVAGSKNETEIILHANYIKVNNEDETYVNITAVQEQEFKSFWDLYQKKPLTGRNIILNSMCPQLYGMYIVRLAVTLVLTGGVSRNDQSGTKVRGESHLLLVGDPGTGKSQFLKYASKIVPRSIMTTGIGSTSAGLTATASKSGGSWHLEPGALVLADGGICCVDEFNCMKEADKTSMLEAMEQQTISVAKAGIVCKLKTKCAVLAACNPKGSYDSNHPLTVNIAMSTPLLSRFDVILLMLDTPNKEWDSLASRFLLQGKDLSNNYNKCEIWEFDKLKLYLNYVKGFEPVLTTKANVIIQRYYQLQRESDKRSASRTTVRMLESVVRLSQAHAKLMHRKLVEVMDVVVAIILIECSSNRTEIFGDVNTLHTGFPLCAESEYKQQIEVVCEKLNIEGEILDEELSMISETFEPFCNQNESFKDEELHQPSKLISQLTQSASKIGIKNQTPYTNRSQYSKSNVINDNFQNQSIDERSSQALEMKTSTQTSRIQNPVNEIRTSTQTNKIQNSVNEMKNKKRLLEEFQIENNETPAPKIQKTHEQSSRESSQLNSKTMATQMNSQSQFLKNITSSYKPTQNLAASNDWDEKDLEMDD